MKSVLSPLVFLLALIFGAVAFSYATIHYGSAMRDLSASAKSLPDGLKNLGVSSQYVVWADILLAGDKLILLAFIVMARIFLAVTGGMVGFVIGPRAEADPWRDSKPASARNRSRNRRKASAFDQWG
jgi:hypothetical protein